MNKSVSWYIFDSQHAVNGSTFPNRLVAIVRTTVCNLLSPSVLRKVLPLPWSLITRLLLVPIFVVYLAITDLFYVAKLKSWNTYGGLARAWQAQKPKRELHVSFVTCPLSGYDQEKTTGEMRSLHTTSITYL